VNTEELNMNINETEFELKVEPSAEALWEEFERTGSVKTYLRFAEKSQGREEKSTFHLPVLS
jgi:hypothetical protein